VRKGEIGRIVSILRGEGDVAADEAPLPSIFDLSVSAHAGHARAFLKIQDGCDARCSYCIVPRARGVSRSRPAEDILAEAERLTRNGYREIVLTGVNTGAYGKDTGDGANLAVLLRRLLQVDGIGRIRLGSLEMGDLTDELLALVAADERICPHFHIPLQSGDDGILGRMNRGYSAEEYLRMAERIKGALELPALTTDVIVGFPGEGEAEFQRTVDLSRRVGFSRIHVFSFSARPGTPAAAMPGRVPPPVMRRRKEALQAAGAEMCRAYHERMVGREADLLVEYGRDPQTGLLHGHTERYVGVLADGPKEWMGTMKRVRVTELCSGHLRGNVVP
jgi:threonylcarbamoyladenosine tRNA methylthiotransferase MtaB